MTLNARAPAHPTSPRGSIDPSLTRAWYRCQYCFLFCLYIWSHFCYQTWVVCFCSCYFQNSLLYYTEEGGPERKPSPFPKSKVNNYSSRYSCLFKTLLSLGDSLRESILRLSPSLGQRPSFSHHHWIRQLHWTIYSTSIPSSEVSSIDINHLKI